jgi:hypothetical protein
MAAKHKQRKFAVGMDVAEMKPFPVCCSAKILASFGARGTTDVGGDQVKADVHAKIPNNIRELNRQTCNKLMRQLPASLRTWPIRIWYSFQLFELYTKRTTGVGGGDGYHTKTFVVSDNVVGNRLYESGSGFALWCRSVPGVKVVRSGIYPGAHGGVCESYFITITDANKVNRYLQRTVKMVNRRLNKLRTSPARIRAGANRATVPEARGFNTARYW